MYRKTMSDKILEHQKYREKSKIFPENKTLLERDWKSTCFYIFIGNTSLLGGNWAIFSKLEGK